MGTPRSEKSSRVAGKLEDFLVANFTTPLVQFQTELRFLEKELLDGEPSIRNRIEIKRRCAEIYCSQCLERRTDWEITAPALAALDEIGFSDLERRGHFAILVCQYSADKPEAFEFAQAFATNALKRVKCLSTASTLRKSYESKLARYAR